MITTASVYDGALAHLAQRLDWLLKSPGIGRLTGEPGLGKDRRVAQPQRAPLPGAVLFIRFSSLSLSPSRPPRRAMRHATLRTNAPVESLGLAARPGRCASKHCGVLAEHSSIICMSCLTDLS